MRITEGIMTNNYTRNLQTNIKNLSDSNLKLTSQRKFNHVSEDTAAAAKAFSLRRQIDQSEEHIRTVEDAMGELNTAGETIITVSSILKTVYETATRGGGAMDQDAMDAVAKSLDGLKSEILQTMNGKYGDKYLFSGSANDGQPFTVGADGTLLFNGKPVDDYDPADPDTYFPENKEVYLDIGFGIDGQAGINAKTGIKISTSGVDVLGYGTEDGQPNNIYSLIGKMADEFKAGDKEGALKTLDHLKKKESNISMAISEVGTRQNMVERTKDRLDSGLVHLKESQKNIEAVSLEEESINNKSYMAAWMVTLQLGSNIIPPSVFDFMR